MPTEPQRSRPTTGSECPLSRDLHTTTIRTAAHLAAGEELADDSRPTWAEAQADQPEPLPARPRRWIRDSNGFAWEAVYPENER